MVLDEDQSGKHPLVAVNDTRKAVSGKVRVTDMESGKKIYSGNFTIEANGRSVLAHLSRVADKGMFLITCEMEGETYKNHYLYGEKPFDVQKVTQWLKTIGIYNEAECLSGH